MDVSRAKSRAKSRRVSSRRNRSLTASPTTRSAWSALLRKASKRRTTSRYGWSAKRSCWQRLPRKRLRRRLPKNGSRLRRDGAVYVCVCFVLSNVCRSTGGACRSWCAIKAASSRDPGTLPGTQQRLTVNSLTCALQPPRLTRWSVLSEVF